MRLRLPWLLALTMAAAACTVGGDDPSGAGGSPGSDAGLDAAAGSAGSAGEAGDGASTEPPAVEGHWAQLLFYASINDIPAVGQTNGSITTIQRLSVERDGTNLTMQATPCVIEIDNGTPVIATIIPDAFVQSLGTTPRSGSLVSDGPVWRFVQDEDRQLRGLELDDPANDPLPTEASDPHVWDQDGDGKPGVTVRITGITDGEVYVVQRDTHSLAGLVAGDRVDGLVEWRTEQVVLGSDNPILNAQTSSVKDPDSEASYVRSTRIGATKTCEEILAEREQLFAR